ncbi:duf895 domain membrane protein [Seiridium cupressi]
MSTNKAAVQDAAVEPASEATNTNDQYSWYRGVFFNATIVGIFAFAAPGLWNAMNSVGAGGQQTPYLVMAGNAILFAIMTFTFGYVIYSAALYTNNRYSTVWFIYLGSAACGVSAGTFWATEGAVMLSYPAPEKRGRYLAYWLTYRNSGSILGGIINLAFNYQGSSTGKLDWRTYIVFVVLQCLGPAVSFLLSPADKVRRRNGTRVQVAERVSDTNELRGLLQVLLRKDFLILGACPGRSNPHFGAFLDWTKFDLNKRARYSYIFTTALIGGCWIWGTIVQNKYTHHKPALDWDDAGFGRGWALYIFCFLAREPKETVRYMSVARGAEAAGQCIASGISSTSTPLISALWVSFALWGLALVPAWFAVRQIGIVHHGPERPLSAEQVNVHKQQSE